MSLFVLSFYRLKEANFSPLEKKNSSRREISTHQRTQSVLLIHILVYKLKNELSEGDVAAVLDICVHGQLSRPERLHWCGLSSHGQLPPNRFRGGCLLPHLHTEGLHLRGLPVLRLHPGRLPERESPRGRVLLCGFRKHRMLLSSGGRKDNLSFYSLPWTPPQLHWYFTAWRRMPAVWTDWLHPWWQKIRSRTLLSDGPVSGLPLS